MPKDYRDTARNGHRVLRYCKRWSEIYKHSRIGDMILGMD